MSVITLRTTEQEQNIMKQFAESKGITLSQLVRDIVMERIEDEYDIAVYENYLKNKAGTKMLTFEDAKELWK